MAIMVGDASSTRIDMYTLGFSGRCKDYYKENVGSLEAALAIEGRISTPKSKASSRYIQITFDLEHKDGSYVDSVCLDIHYARQGHDLIFTDRCKISGNGLTLVRGVLGDAPCGELSFDGKANVLGRCHAALDAVELQIPLLVQAFEFCREFLNRAFPGWNPKAVWLKKVEACRDLQVDNAIGAMRIIQHSSLHGATHRLLDQYRRIGDSEQKCFPVVGFIEHKRGPRAKYYAKRDHDLRIELAAHHRKEVTAFTGTKRASFTGKGVRTLFLHFLTKVGARLDQLEQHAREALGSETSITELIVSLKSMIDRAAGDKKVKGPASAKASVLAGRWLDALLSVGMCDAIGSHANHAIRRDLDALCTEDGPLVRHVGRAIYYLKPKYARACSAIRSASSMTATVQL